MFSNNKLIPIITIILFSKLLFSQEKDIVFEQITNESGRSLGFITGITQDNTGFMWFATRNGLYRYNGYSYKLFKHSKSDSLSLPFNDITSLYYDHNNNLWMRHYDELTVFNNEKRCFDFDSITKQHYDIEVEILQDNKGYYWIGPTGNGLLRYSELNSEFTVYNHPPNTYSPKAWNYLDSLISNNNTLGEIRNPGNESDTCITFYINNDGYYLISSSGEYDKYGIYDFGSLLYEQEVIWSLSKEKAMWSGGEEKNQFEASLIRLTAGAYTLTYKSDISHSCNHWDGKGPDKINFCGIAVHEISPSDIELLNSGLLNAATGKNFILSNHIKDILTDKDGNIWALTDKGLEKYDYKNEKFTHFEIDFEGKLGTSIEKEYLKLFQDKQGTFWIGSMYGLIKYDHVWNKFVVFQNSGKIEILTSNAIYSIFEDNNNQIWIGTDKGLNIYNRERNTITKIKANNHNRLYDNRIIQIFEDNANNIWVATFEGLNRLIKSKFLYTNLKIKADHSYPAIYDESANIWYGYGKKILKYSRTLTTIEEYELPAKIFNISSFTGEADYTINDLIKTQDHHLWIASDNKVSRFNYLTKQIDFTKELSAIIVGNDSLKNSVKQLIKGVGKIYAFCPNGFYLINSENLKIESFLSFNFNIDFIDEFDLNYFKTALKDKKGNLWIRTSDGVYTYNCHLQNIELVHEFPDEFKNGPISAGQMDFDKFGNIWFATLPYVNSISIESHKTESWKCDFDHEWGIANTKVSKDIAWNYGSNGLYSFNIKTKEFNYYSIENGFIDNNINGLETDKSGYIWLTSLKGLIKLDTAENSSKNFFTSSHFTTRNFLGNPPNFKTPGGEKILFTTNGFVSFYPDSINRNIPKIVIDRFTIRGKDFELDSLIYYKHNIKLKHNQNFLSFEFAVLDYTDPALNKYKYKLEGLEDEWNYADALNRKVNYSGIAHGNYTLKVTGANNDKVWNTKGVELKITIAPPWYKTTLAYILYMVLVVSAIWIFIKVREKRLIEEKRVLEQKVRERTAEIEAQKEELAAQNEKIAEQHKNITDSIHYAQRIQSAILPPVEQLSEVVDEFFILYRPRDIVSGDYYWATRHNELTIIVAADCTGHGVPGAFMSMLGIAFLNEIVNKEGVFESDEILNMLRRQIITQLHQTGEQGESKDGMDLSLYVINHDKMKLYFSGAYNPLFIIRNNEVIQLKADRMPIGYHLKKDLPFTKQEFDLQKGDCLYNSSDGYPDQFGGTDNRKYMTKRFKEFLLQIHKKPMAEQHKILNKEFDNWRGETEQIDDVIVIGVRV